MNHKDHTGLIKDTVRDSGYEKAAKFLIIIGKEEAAKVLPFLTEEEVQTITREIARIDTVDNREASKILEEFGYLVKTRNVLLHGGLEKAKEMLVASYGEQKGAVLYEKLRLKTIKNPFAFLSQLKFEQVMMLLKNESAPVIGAILSYVEPRLAAKIIMALKPDLQKTVAKRIAILKEVNPDTLRRAEDSLKEKIEDLGEMTSLEIDGQAVLAGIMKHLDLGTENLLLESIDSFDPDIAESIKERLFTVDVVLKIRGIDLQNVLRDYTDEEVALLLKGKDDRIKEKILDNVSDRRAESIRLEYDNIGKVLKSDVDKLTKDFLNYLRQCVEKGEVVILDGDDVILE